LLEGIGVDLDAADIEAARQPVRLIEAVANGWAIGAPLGTDR